MGACLQTAAFFKGGEQCRPGGCALLGAKLALQPITDAVHVVHGSGSCLGHVWSSRPTASSGSHLHRHSVSTALGEIDLVLGSSERLQNLLDRVAAELKPAAIFVYQSCLTAMVGQDLHAECHIANKRLNIPVLAVEASGLEGGKQLGNRLAAKLLCEHVIGTREPAFSGHADINLIGEFNVHGEVEQLRVLLQSFGIRILASIPGDARYQDVACAHRARLSLDLCSQSMPRLAEFLKEKYGIPYLRGSLYGGYAFSESLRHLVRALIAMGADPEMEDKLNLWLDDQLLRFRKSLLEYRAKLSGKRVLIDVGGVKSWALLEDLQSAGLVIRGVSTRKCSKHDAEQHGALRRKSLLHGINPWQQQDVEGLLKANCVDLVISSDRIKYIAQKCGIPHVDISHGRSFSLLGFDGILNLLEQIDHLVNSPIPTFVQPQMSAKNSAERSAAKIIPPPPGAINPFALAQSAGAALAMQGVRCGSALLFGSQGCAAGGLTFLSRYFGEQISLATVSMNEIDSIHGGHHALQNTVAELEAKHSEVIAILSPGVMEAQGCSSVALQKHSRKHASAKIFLHAPEFEGTLELGWAKTTHALIHHALSLHSRRSHCHPRRLLILPAVHLSICDVDWIKEVAEDFELEPLVVPDISTALDGRAGEQAVFDGGVAFAEIEKLSECAAYLSLGQQVCAAANLLDRAGIAGLTLSSWTGICRTDEILNHFAQISGLPIPKKYRIQRERAFDAMIDHMPQLGSTRAMVAAEPELLADLCGLLCELGLQNLVALSPISAPCLRSLPVEQVHVGDYQLLARLLPGRNLLLAPDSAQELAQAAGIGLYPVGIHEPRRTGLQFRSRIGYHGLSEQIFSFVNLLKV